MLSRILLIVSILMVIGSAVLGFYTKDKITVLRGEIADQKATIATRDASIAKLETEKEAALADAASWKEKAEQLEVALNQTKDELSKSQDDLAKANALVAEKQQEIDDYKAAEAARTGGPDTEGVVTENPLVLELRQQLGDAQAQLAESQQVNESLQSKVADVEGQLMVLREKDERRNRQQNAAGLQGQILAVNRNWNFVVLSVGDRQGAVVGGEMVVVRGDTAIAKLRITSVEPTTSIADVVAGSVARGVLVQPGDMVIYPGDRP